MRKYIVLFFSALAVLCSCSDNAPSGVIEEEKMIALLMDVHTIDGTLFNIPSVPDSLYKLGTGKYINVFNNHHTDSSAFVKSLEYYASKPEILSPMYDTIAKRLQVRIDSATKQLQKEQASTITKNPKMMMRGKGMQPEAVKPMPNIDSMRLAQRKKSDSIRRKLRLDSIKFKQKGVINKAKPI